jgi:hypothetical protein
MHFSVVAVEGPSNTVCVEDVPAGLSYFTGMAGAMLFGIGNCSRCIFQYTTFGTYSIL